MAATDETDRSGVQVPESLGVRLLHGNDKAECVVWTGGRADIDFLGSWMSRPMAGSKR